MTKAQQTIWYHSASPPQIIGSHNNGCFIGNYDGLHKCLTAANNHSNFPNKGWSSVVIAQSHNGDYHLFQTFKHWQDYPSRSDFSASYETIKV